MISNIVDQNLSTGIECLGILNQKMIISLTVILVITIGILPVYAQPNQLSNPSSKSVPKDTHTCTTLPDGRQDCIDTHYQCDTRSVNGECLNYHTISSRWICTILKDGINDCTGIGMNDTINQMPKLQRSQLSTPMNTTNLTTPVQSPPQQSLPVNQTNRSPIVPVFGDSNSTNPIISNINNTLVIHNIQSTYSGPSWIGKVFSWYDQGQFSEKDMISLIKWLIQNKIMGS